jgi:hypothetical protein
MSDFHLGSRERLLTEEPLGRAQEATMSTTGRLHSLTSGCFPGEQLQRPLFGNEPGKGFVMSRPEAAGGDFLVERLVPP